MSQQELRIPYDFSLAQLDLLCEGLAELPFKRSNAMIVALVQHRDSFIQMQAKQREQADKMAAAAAKEARAVKKAGKAPQDAKE